MKENTNQFTVTNSKDTSSISALTTVSAIESNAVEISKIYPLKIGGTIKCIDEKLEVNASNNKTGSTIPLPITQDRNDFFSSSPLSSNSGSNDPLGLGWSVDDCINQWKQIKKDLILSHEFIAVGRDNFSFEYLVK